MSPTELLELVMRAIPYPNLVGGIDVHGESGALLFAWRSHRFRVEEGRTGIGVEEVVQHGFLGSDIAILMEAVLWRAGPPREEVPMPTKAKTVNEFEVHCPYCPEGEGGGDGDLKINLNDLASVTCTDCETEYSPREAADKAAGQARRWEAVARWVEAAGAALAAPEE